MSKVKYFICPMSKEIIDSVIEMNDERLGLLPSRRQVDYDSGYVMDTRSFFKYVRNKSNITLERDHGGVGQGIITGDEYKSFELDSGYMDIIHIDPWKVYSEFHEGLFETIRNLEFLDYNNKNLRYEVGTEESIRPFTLIEMGEFLDGLKSKLHIDLFTKIDYICIQSGVGLDIVNRKNTGDFNLSKLKKMITTVKFYDKKSKEHNGDYLTEYDYKIRFKNGLDSINIGPEIAQIQTQTYLEIMTPLEVDEFYQICLNSNQWKKWVKDDFDPTNKQKMILTCGHYNFDKINKKFSNLEPLDDINDIIKDKIKSKLAELLSYV